MHELVLLSTKRIRSLSWFVCNYSFHKERWYIWFANYINCNQKWKRCVYMSQVWMKIMHCGVLMLVCKKKILNLLRTLNFSAIVFKPYHSGYICFLFLCRKCGTNNTFHKQCIRCSYFLWYNNAYMYACSIFTAHFCPAFCSKQFYIHVCMKKKNNAHTHTKMFFFGTKHVHIFR